MQKLRESLETIRRLYKELGRARLLIGVFILVTLFYMRIADTGKDVLKIIYASVLLTGIGLLGHFIFRLRQKDFTKELYYFLGFIVLLFSIIYCVSFLEYEVQGVKHAKEAAEESKASAEESLKAKEESKASAEESLKAKEESEEIVRTTVKILDLSDKAGWQNNGGDFKSYNALLLLQKEIKNNELQKILDEQIDSIKNSYDADIIWQVADSFPYICQISDPPCAKGIEPVKAFNAKNVYEHLTDLYKLWPEHARAASLLRNIDSSPNKADVMCDVYHWLVERMKKEDEKLLVRKIAFETYKKLMGFYPESDGIFGFKTAIDNWESRKKECQK